MDLEDGLTALDKIVTQFNTYEDYLDSQITDEDLYYLEVRSAARLATAFQSLRVVGRLPPGGKGRASQFPGGGGESPHPSHSELSQAVQDLGTYSLTQGRNLCVRTEAHTLDSLEFP